MTPYLDDIVKDSEPSEALIEVANGNMVKATVSGTVHLRVIDIEDETSYDVYLENVLHVPGLSRRLFSVTQWTNSGGAISFSGDNCTLSYNDDCNPPNHFSATIHAPFSPYEESHHFLYPIANLGTTDQKIPIPSDLLHRRLGHRSIQALGVAKDADLWKDATVKMSEEKFCWDCNITFSRKASRGKSPLSNDKAISPGSCLMLDLHDNPSKKGLTRLTHYSYYLQVTDALTRFTVLLGVTDMSAYSV